MLLNLVGIALLTALGPTERTLGANLRLVILHGAWVWTGILTFTLSALAGLFWLLVHATPGARSNRWRSWAAPAVRWSAALSRAALGFWLTYLPMSLYVMRVNWGGFAFSEPRWRIPLTLGVVAVLLQFGLALINRPWASALGNFLFGVVLVVSLAAPQNILHPDSPIAQSGSARIRAFFLALLALCLLLSLQISAWWQRRLK